MMSEMSKSLLEKPFFASSLTLLLFKWIYLNTSRNYSETITQCVCRNEFSLALEGLLIGFWATSHKTSIHLIMLSLYMNTEKCVSWPNIEYEAGKKSIVLFQRHLGALTLVCLSHLPQWWKIKDQPTKCDNKVKNVNSNKDWEWQTARHTLLYS